MVQSLCKTVWNFFTQLKMELPFDSAIPPLGLYPNNPEKPTQNNLCTDVDPDPSDPYAGPAVGRFTWTTEILWRKRDGMATLQVRKGMRATESPREILTSAQTGFYCFSGHITMRMVLLY